MKCIHCEADTPYPERKDLKRCAHCQRAFAFEPREGDPFTDKKFRAAIERVSAQGKVRWNKEHLRHELIRRLNPTSMAFAPAVLATLSALFGFFLLLADNRVGWLLLIAAAALTAFAITSQRESPLHTSVFDGYWQRWLRAHGDPAGLIARRSERKPAQPGPALPSDIEEYSFDRAVVCDRSETVDLLLANNFHFENNCAVLSFDGYPERVFSTVRAMLKKNPKLVAFVLHDATVPGCLLAQRVAESPEWFPGARVVDVGLRPVHTQRLSKHYDEGRGLVTDEPAIRAQEHRWLRQHSCELSALLPEQVIKRLFRALSRHSEVSIASTSQLVVCASYLIDVESFATPATTSDGGGDSFG
jgi:hypothetical protein